MSALRLEVETHIVTASATAVQNLTKCVAAAGVKIDELVVDSLASAEAVLSETEKELGVAVADIGAGTIDLALFQDGSPFHTRVLPVGGANVTNDVAIGLKTSIQVAEELKIQHGTCDLRDDRRGRADQRLGPRRGRRADRQPARGVADHRGPDARDVRAAARTRSGRPGSGMLPAGIILTGGGVAARGRRRARSRGPPDAGPHRRPVGHRRAGRHAPEPELQHGRRAAPVGRRQPRLGRAATATSRRRPAAVSGACATPSGASSRRHARADGPDRPRPRPGRPDRRLRLVRGRRRRPAATVSCRSSSRTPPRASSSSRSGRARTTTCWPRWTGCCRARSGCTAIVTARPGHGADHVLPLLAPPSLTVPVVERPARARDVAVDLPARPECGQRRPDRPPELPARADREPTAGGASWHRSRAPTPRDRRCSAVRRRPTGGILPPAERTRSAPGRQPGSTESRHVAMVTLVGR